MLQLLTQAVHRSPRCFIWVATLLGIGVVLAVFAAVIADSRNTAWIFNEQAIENVAVLVEQDIARNIEMFDLSLQAVSEGAADPKIMAFPSTLRNQVLFDRSSSARGLGLTVVLDSAGRVVMDSSGTVPVGLDLSERDYFQAHKTASQDIGLFVSRPFTSRVNGSWLIGFSRRITGADGAFLGVVVGGVKLDYIRSLFDAIDLGQNGSISLYRTDGFLVVRTSETDPMFRSEERSTAVLDGLGDRNSALFVSARSSDAIERLYAVRRLANLPLVVSAGRGTRQIEQSWWRKTLTLSVILIVMSTAVLALVKLLDKELVRRIRAEQQSATLARTDGLTGLANRRMFDESLDREWASAQREGSSLALLLLDVDWFKLFNDGYGHQAGDAALVALAGLIGRIVRRSTDLSARYGGEEFVVLLPRTDLAGATALARTLCLGMHGLGIRNGASPLGRLTISCGVAAVTPTPASEAIDLIKTADDALYRAKQCGRNQVRGDGSDAAAQAA